MFHAAHSRLCQTGSSHSNMCRESAHFSHRLLPQICHCWKPGVKSNHLRQDSCCAWLSAELQSWCVICPPPALGLFQVPLKKHSSIWWNVNFYVNYDILKNRRPWKTNVSVKLSFIDWWLEFYSVLDDFFWLCWSWRSIRHPFLSEVISDERSISLVRYVLLGSFEVAVNAKLHVPRSCLLHNSFSHSDLLHWL